MVPWNVHKQVALLVVEAYQKFILGRNLGSLIMEGVKQVCAVKEYRPRGYKTFFMPNSTEHEISDAHKNYNTDK